MSMNKYVASLLPSIDKDMLLKDVDRIKKELTQSTIPAFDASHDLLEKWSFKDQYSLDMERMFSRNVKTRFKGNYIVVTGEVVKRVLLNVNNLEKHISSQFGNQIIRSAITYSRSQIIQLIEAYSFITKYSRMMLINTLNVETKVITKQNGASFGLSTIQRKWLINNREVFIRLINSVDKTPAEMDRILKSIPDATVDTESDSMVALVGASKLDPLTLGFSVRKLNPIYHVRMAWEDWMYNRLEKAREERQLVEYQLMDLNNAREGRKDPKLDRAIEYTEDRLIKLDYKISKLEEE